MNKPDTETRSRERQDAFIGRVRQRRDLHEKHRREGLRSFWNSVGTMGTVGWSVSLPMAGGALFGKWIDSRLDSGYVFMFFFLFVGLGTGCAIAWRMISEHR